MSDKCPSCSAPLINSPKFCPECGAKIAAPAANEANENLYQTNAQQASAQTSSPVSTDKIWIAQSKEPVYMHTKMINRHGLVAGATGTGKTVTIKVLAEFFSELGVPVFMGDIKGDVSGLCRMGEPNKNVDERVKNMNISNFAYASYPVRFFDVYGNNGIPVRATISDMGPLLISRILGLNETQSSILQIIFKIADDNQLLLIDLKDLKAMTQYASENAKDLQSKYGTMSTQSIGTIQRNILTLSQNGGDIFFGEPALDLHDWMSCDDKGRGFINILDCVKLFQNPMLYSTFLLWMLSALYEMLPEVGDLDKPKMVFFFDEAHILFTDAPKTLLQKIEQVARLIRSKGVGIYFITQSPSDIPDNVLSQLGNKIQHALRAYTPKDQKAVKATAASFRVNPEFDSENVLGELSTGEALVSVLDEKGAPKMVERAFILPPKSFIGPASGEQIKELTHNSPLYKKYGETIDRESAYEILEKQKQDTKNKLADKPAKAVTSKKTTARKTSSPAKKALSSAMTQIGKGAGQALVRGLFGNLR